MKPCPFCFGDGKIEKMRGATGQEYFVVECHNCFADGPMATSEAEAVKKWDTRWMSKRQKADQN